jgi:hypothetical protein
VADAEGTRGTQDWSHVNYKLAGRTMQSRDPLKNSSRFIRMLLDTMRFVSPGYTFFNRYKDVSIHQG